MKDSVFVDFISLAYVEIVKLKNNFIEALKHPVTAIKAIGSFIFPFLLILFVYTRKDGGASNMLRAAIKPHILSAVIMAVLLLVFILTIYNSISKYNPSQFCSADVNYLFPLPISPRTIFAWTIVRKCIKNLLESILLVIVMAIVISKVYDIRIFKLIYLIIAMWLFPILQNSLIFFIYTLSNKFNLGKIIKYCVLGFTGVIITYLLYNIINSKNIGDALISNLNGEVFSNIPIAGWLRDMLIASIVSNKPPLIQTISLIIITAAILFSAIYFADDYYEEAGACVHYYEKIDDTSSRDTVYDMADNLEVSKKSKSVGNISAKEFTGPWAFIWKSYIINKRTAKNGRLIGYAIAVIASIAMCYFLRGKEFNSVYPLFVLIFLQGAVVASKISSPLKYEIKKQYIFLLPGSAAKKLLAINVRPMINNLITDTLMIIPLLFFTKTSVLQLIFLWFTAVTSIGICYFSVVVVVLITPPNDRSKNSIISTALSYLMFAPSIIVAILAAIYLKNTIFALSMFIISSTVIIMILLYLSDFLFSKLELR
ncbi:putative ABC exporter domain-containing protein [Clostridium hydrogenum]|uniref:putative ABC exporter domain-containing protein n=1 Tax=Clostridium hydrogenum TaxID=2855764 RepID=UPI001F2DBC6C|nr:putative ABC exporter domain-containing protein [Clostridium hydrogenum]